MIIAVASGKGGTGKTTVAVNMALSIGNVQFLDCDVEEPNAHLFLKPRIASEEKAFIPVPRINSDKCTYCGICASVCAYHAIAVIPPKVGTTGNVMIFDQLCHGCGACKTLCPYNAIEEVEREIGIVACGEKEGIAFINGKLNIGEAMSPPLIRQVKQHIDPQRTVIIDAPPGTSCPVITAVKGSDFCILVTEPTPFGLNDLILAVEVLRKIKIPCGVVINRADIGDTEVDDYCKREDLPVLMRIPFEREIAVAYSKGIPIVEHDGSYKDKFKTLFAKISENVR